MNIAAYHRQQRQMAGAQEAYDNMLPPEYWENDEDEVIDPEDDQDEE